MKIKIKTPVANNRGQDYHKSRASVKMMYDMGVMKLGISCHQWIECTGYNSVQYAKSRIDFGDSDRLKNLSKQLKLNREKQTSIKIPDESPELSV